MGVNLKAVVDGDPVQSNEVVLDKVKVTQEEKEALDRQCAEGFDEWDIQFRLIGHAKAYSGDGIRLDSAFLDDFEVLNRMKPLRYAKCLLLGYYTEGEESNEAR